MRTQYQGMGYKSNNHLALLKKAFPSDKLDTIEDYVDLFLRIRGAKFQKYFIDFCLLCRSRGFNYNSCQIRELILDRLLYGDYKIFKLKKINEIDEMTGEEFEVFLARFFFNRCGYLVDLTKRSHDKGSDLIVQINGIRTVIQAKRRKQHIGIKAVQEVYAAMGYHGTDKAMVVISSRFSKPAKKFAERLNVELWDRQFLMQQLKAYNFQI